MNIVTPESTQKSQCQCHCLHLHLNLLSLIGGRYYTSPFPCPFAFIWAIHMSIKMVDLIVVSHSKKCPCFTLKYKRIIIQFTLFLRPNPHTASSEENDLLPNQIVARTRWNASCQTQHVYFVPVSRGSSLIAGISLASPSSRWSLRSLGTFG